MFVSNRLQDTHKEATRNNLIKENYPKELLQDFHWWMSGVKDSEQNIVKEKEDRYHYLNSNKLHIKEGIAVNICIIMVLGDDFNSNFTNAKDNIYRNYYLEDNDVQQLFGQVAPAVRFTRKNTEITKYYANCGQQPDKLLKNKKYLDNIQEELTCWYSTYGLIGGNAMYGGWDSCF